MQGGRARSPLPRARTPTYAVRPPRAARIALAGEWDAVVRAVRECHESAHALGCERVVSSWRVETGNKAAIGSTTARLAAAHGRLDTDDERSRS